MKIVAISDTHNKHDKLKIPECDVLVHAGDFTHDGFGFEAERFLDWFIKQPARERILIAGNHDFITQSQKGDFNWSRIASPYASKVIFLYHSSTVIDGVKFYGDPSQFNLRHWAHYLSPDCAKDNWNEIPLDTDVLITHIPPKGLGDKVLNWNPRREPSPHVGCEHLLNRIHVVRPKLHIYGHIHEGYGAYLIATGLTTCINAASCQLNSSNMNQPIMWEIDNEANRTGTGTSDQTT